MTSKHCILGGWKRKSLLKESADKINLPTLVAIWHPPAVSLYLGHVFHSKSEDVKGNRVKTPFWVIRPFHDLNSFFRLFWMRLFGIFKTVKNVICKSWCFVILGDNDGKIFTYLHITVKKKICEEFQSLFWELILNIFT